MAKRGDVIYCLVDELEERPFYVGRSQDSHKRYHEHRRNARTGSEAKYQHIRKLWANGNDFNVVVLDESPGERYERYYHYVLGIEYDLTNQKLGDKQAQLVRITNGMRSEKKEYTGPKEFLSDYDRRVNEERALKEAARTQAKIRKVAVELTDEDVARTLYSFEKIEERFMSPAARAIKERNKK